MISYKDVYKNLTDSMNYSSIVDWTWIHAQTSASTNTEGYKVGNLDFTVQSTSYLFFNQFGNMSVKKVCSKKT